MKLSFGCFCVLDISTIENLDRKTVEEKILKVKPRKKENNMVELLSDLLIKCKSCKAIVDAGFSMDFESFCSSEMENSAVFVIVTLVEQRLFGAKMML